MIAGRGPRSQLTVRDLQGRDRRGPRSPHPRTIPDWNSLPAAAIENRKLWQHLRVSWLTRSASLFPPSSLILHNGGLLEYSLKVKVALNGARPGQGRCSLGYAYGAPRRNRRRRTTFARVYFFVVFCIHTISSTILA